MRKKWYILLFLLPIALFCEQESKGFFHLELPGEELLHNIALDEEILNNEMESLFGPIQVQDYDCQELSLMELDERDESLALWSEGNFACDGESNYRFLSEFEEAFSLEKMLCDGAESYQPSLENVPESKILLEWNARLGL